MNKKYHLIAIFSITALSLLIYLNSLKNGFVYDDSSVILNADIIKDWGYSRLILTEDYFSRSGESTYRPVVTISYFFDHLIWGLNPLGYHLTNLLLHIMNSILVYIFLIHIYSFNLQPSAFSLKLSLLSSLLFASHPVLTEAVNAIAFREDLLVFMFYTASLILYIRVESYDNNFFTKRLFLYLSFMLYLLALFSKEMALTFPLILIVYFLFMQRDNFRASKISELKSFAVKLLGYAIITVFYIYIRFFCFYLVLANPKLFIIANGDLGERLIALPKMILNYIRLLFFPLNLSVEYTFAFTSFPFSFDTVISAGIIVVIFYTIIKLIKNSADALYRQVGILSFGILWFFITLIPVMNLLPIANPLAERYLYLPSAGFSIIIGGAIILLLSEVRATSTCIKNLFTAGIITSFIFIVIFNSLIVIKRNPIWYDDYNLWRDAIKKTPESKRAHNNLGKVYLNDGLHERAMTEFKNALRIDGDFPDAHFNIGIIYEQEGLPEKAINEFKRVINVNPLDGQAYIRLGFLYDKKGLFDDAFQSFKKAEKIDPKYSVYALIRELSKKP